MLSVSVAEESALALVSARLSASVAVVSIAVILCLLRATAIAQFFLAAVLGLGLGWLYPWTGSLWPPIVAHLTLDLATGLLLARTLKRDILLVEGD